MNVLEQIIERTCEEVDRRRRDIPMRELEAEISARGEPPATAATSAAV